MSDAKEIKNCHTGEFRVPSSQDVELVLSCGPWCSCSTFSGKLWHLLMAGFCLALLIGCTTSTACPSPELSAFQQSLRTADREILEQTTKVVSGISENTVALSEIKEKIDGIAAQLEAAQVSSQSDSGKEVIKSEDTSPDNTAHDSQLAQGSGAESGDVPVYVSVTTFCRPCNQIKKDWKAGKLKGFDVKFCVETETHRQQLIAEDIPADRVIVDTWNGTPFPAIRHPSKDSASGWVVKVPHGYGPEVLHDLRRDLLGINGEGIEQTFPQTSTPMQSHGDLVSLHNSLHGGGNWTWPGDLATHLMQSHGVDLNGTATSGTNNQVGRQQNAVRLVSRWSTRGWRQNFVSRQSCPSGASN